MKKSSIIEARRKLVNPVVRQRVELSFQIVDRIHEILESKGLKQKDLAMMLGKKEAEISKWMRGTHNFTIDTLVSIENALGAPILQVVHQEIKYPDYEYEPMMASEPVPPPKP
ncbi:helix-turn-helix transcriptional regulator [Prevotella sp. RM4]|jgi:transcriptional regulator with XRE-family HTH domain|uniref:helix-turn-helix domain-containing protein n=1 Tax=Prevotella sp. RM4 TaxID=1200547 RepID=UPI000689F91A|nr:helix-turn-helix transcriptional regulator [Prevotella sp. RM4]